MRLLFFDAFFSESGIFDTLNERVLETELTGYNAKTKI